MFGSQLCSFQTLRSHQNLSTSWQSRPCSGSSSVFISCLVLFNCFFISQLWKGLEHILMLFCLLALYLRYLFLLRCCFSPSYAVTAVGLFITTKKFFVNCVVFRLFLVSSLASCPHEWMLFFQFAELKWDKEKVISQLRTQLFSWKLRLQLLYILLYVNSIWAYFKYVDQTSLE